MSSDDRATSEDHASELDPYLWHATPCVCTIDSRTGTVVDYDCGRIPYKDRTPDDGAPACDGCDNILDRIDHYGIEHFILDGSVDGGVYREVNVEEGLASEVDLRCGYCGAPIPRHLRSFFYDRWCRILAIINRRE